MATDATGFANVAWFKSSHSITNGACVEAAVLPTVVGTRDSKLDASPVLAFGHDRFRAFVAGVRQG
ncbi:DUF397 domain-containing protein [Embleya sp. NPDC056575]|uniref:DUF397 domain-containing protein n=1 Tax=unclassified Embleya TaxID=2699296 RepID=UPI003699B365